MSSIKLVKQDADTIAIGNNSIAAGTSIAIGVSATARNSYSTALGNCAWTGDSTCATAVGFRASVSGGVSTVVGANATAAGFSTAIGASTSASGTCATAIGAEAKALAPGATAIGYGAKAGTDAAGGAYWGTAIGCGATAKGCGLAIGPGTAADAGQISIGTGGATCTVSATQFFAAMGGTTAVELATSGDTGVSTIASVNTYSAYGIAKTDIVPMNIVGSGAVSVCANGNSIVINADAPSSSLCGETTGCFSWGMYTKLGCGANSCSSSVVIGYHANGCYNTIAIGSNVFGLDSAIAIGCGVRAEYKSVAIGSEAIGYGSGGGSSLALGYKADPKAYDSVAFSNGVENVYLSWSNFKAMLVAAGATVETIQSEA